MSAASFFQDLKRHTITLSKWVMGLSVLAFAVWWMLPDNWQIKWQIKYAWEYSVDSDHVVIERKPHNCDWDSAPLGNKHCHYEAVVSTLNSAGTVVESGGKQNTAVGDQNVTKVHVDWQRVED